jgi:peroxiredoxin Q/BCP
MPDIKEGAKAPDFELESAGGPVRLSDFAGKTLVVYFYPKDDTTGCTMEAQQFSALAPEFEKAGATVIGVSKDSVKSHEKFAGKYGLTVRLGSDPEGHVIERFGSWVQKSLYGRQYMGIDRSTFLIKDGTIHKIWRKVKVAGHAQTVLDAVKGT